LDEAFFEDIEFRRGLDNQLHSIFGSFVREISLTNPSLLPRGDAERIVETRKTFSEHIQNLVSSLVPRITATILDQCADELAEDFVRHRLPPPRDEVDHGKEIVFLKCEKGDHSNADIDECSDFEDFPMQVAEDEEVMICDPSNIFMLIQELDGVQTLALAHNRNNDRLAHMGHPIVDISQDESVESSDEVDGDEMGADDDNCTESSGYNSNSLDSKISNSSDVGLMSLFLPLRFGPILLFLKQASARNVFVTPRKVAAQFSNKFNLSEVFLSTY
jgi:hypothetical protein